MNSPTTLRGVASVDRVRELLPQRGVRPQQVRPHRGRGEQVPDHHVVPRQGSQRRRLLEQSDELIKQEAENKRQLEELKKK